MLETKAAAASEVRHDGIITAVVATLNVVDHDRDVILPGAIKDGSAWDEFQQAREAVAREGTTFLDRYNQPRERPEVGTAPAARIAFARLLRELALDVSAPGEPVRPPALGGRWRG